LIRARLVEVRTTRPYSKAALSMGRAVRRRRKREGGAFVVGRPLRAILDYAAWRR
jgi:hypothetical protein